MLVVFVVLVVVRFFVTLAIFAIFVFGFFNGLLRPGRYDVVRIQEG